MLCTMKINYISLKLLLLLYTSENKLYFLTLEFQFSKIETSYCKVLKTN